jgi:transposase
VRQRAELLTHIRNTTSQYNLPAWRTPRKSKSQRAPVVERCGAPAVQKNIEVDVALIDYYDQLIRELARHILATARQHAPETLERLRSVPGMGPILSLGLLYEMHDIARFPRVQDFVSYCRGVKGAKESAGKRYGTVGTKIGHAFLKWACSEAAVLFLQGTRRGQKYCARWEKKHGKGTALTVLAHKLARAVYFMLTRATTCDMDKFMQD